VAVYGRGAGFPCGPYKNGREKELGREGKARGNISKAGKLTITSSKRVPGTSQDFAHRFPRSNGSFAQPKKAAKSEKPHKKNASRTKKRKKIMLPEGGEKKSQRPLQLQEKNPGTFLIFPFRRKLLDPTISDYATLGLNEQRTQEVSRPWGGQTAWRKRKK